MPTLDRTIASNADLGSMSSTIGFVTWDDFSTAAVGESNDAGVADLWARFPNITIPAGSTIDVAYITFTNISSVGEPGNIASNILGIDEDDHAAPTSSGTWDTDEASHTTAVVTWDFTRATTGTRQTPSLVAIIQEIVDRAGWASGNDIGIHVDDDGSADAVQDFDSDPVLHVEYTEASSQQDLTGSLFQSSPTFNSGTVAATYPLTGTLFQSAPTFHAGTVDLGAATISGTLFQSTPTFPTGTVEPGAVDLSGVLFQSTPTFPAGAVAATYPLTGTLYQNTPTFFAGEVTVGPAALTGTLFQSTPTFFAGTVVGVQTLTGTLYQLAPTFPTGTVTAEAATVTGVLFQSTPTFHVGRLFGVVEHPANPATAPLTFATGTAPVTFAAGAAAVADSRGTAATSANTGTADPTNSPGKAE